MQVMTQDALFVQIIDRALEEGANNLREWADITLHRADVWVEPHRDPQQGYILTRETVARGVWRITGGQQMNRPAGWTAEQHSQLSRAMSDLDADHLEPGTASAVIQVGLYGEVRYR